MQGKISAADIQRIAKELGENFSEKEIQDMIDEADRDRKFAQFSSYNWICYVLPFSTTKLCWCCDAIISKTSGQLPKLLHGGLLVKILNKNLFDKQWLMFWLAENLSLQCQKKEGKRGLFTGDSLGFAFAVILILEGTMINNQFKIDQCCI